MSLIVRITTLAFPAIIAAGAASSQQNLPTNDTGANDEETYYIDEVLTPEVKSCLDTFAQVAVDDVDVEPSWTSLREPRFLGATLQSTLRTRGDKTRSAQLTFLPQPDDSFSIVVKGTAGFSEPPSFRTQRELKLPADFSGDFEGAAEKYINEQDGNSNEITEEADRITLLMLNALESCGVYKSVSSGP